jgi:hypothetical protein
MPYILPELREKLDVTDNITVLLPSSAGELNFVITRLVAEFLGPEPRYDDFNEAIGVLESAKLELYRRLVATYEDWKMAENGDVY